MGITQHNLAKLGGQKMTKDILSLLNSPFFVGFDRIHDRLHEFNDTLSKNVPSYPPYNIRKVEENKYIVEIAVAGFSKSDIEIEIDGDVLKIAGKTSDDNDNFLHKGIANRARMMGMQTGPGGTVVVNNGGYQQPQYQQPQPQYQGGANNPYNCKVINNQVRCNSN